MPPPTPDPPTPPPFAGVLENYPNTISPSTNDQLLRHASQDLQTHLLAFLTDAERSRRERLLAFVDFRLVQPGRSREEAALVVAGMESTDVSDAVERTWQILADEEEWISERGAGYLRAMERGIAAG